MQVSSPAPIALFAFRRPVHLHATLEALASNPEAPETDVYAFIDAPRLANDDHLVEGVALTLAEFAERGVFRRLDVSRADAPRGLARSVIDGISAVLQNHDRVIGLEDDILLAPTGLSFLNAALDAYATNSRVWSVSAFTPQLRMPPGFRDSIFFTRRASSWGYATWRDRWEEMDWTPEHFRRLARDRNFRRRLALGGNDLPSMLDKQLAGEIDSWAVRWCAQQAELRAMTAYPRDSLVVNTGMDGSGTHSPIAEQDPQTLGSWREGDTFPEPGLDPTVSRAFRRGYVSRRRLLASRLARAAYLRR